MPVHDLILDCRTRWNSLYEMINRLIEQYPVLVASTLDPRLKKSVETEKLSHLSNDDLEKAEQFIQVFWKLKDITTNLSGQSIPTIGSVLPILFKIKEHMCPVPDDKSVTRDTKKVVLVNLEIRYKKPEVMEFLEEATILDSRFKSKIVNDMAWQRIKDKTVELFPAETRIKIEPEVTEVKEEKSQRTCLTTIFEDSDGEDTVEITGVFAPPTTEETIIKEFSQYKTMGKISKSTNPLTFWKMYNGSLPHLSGIATKYLCVQASSVPSERVFSTAGDTVTAERSRLDPAKVDMVIFLKKNV